MQTFLPYADHQLTARCLDDQRLGKQRLEAIQILSVIHEMRWDADAKQYSVDGQEQAYSHHPAVEMWRGYTGELTLYTRAICREWKSRGFHDVVLRRLEVNFGWTLASGSVPTPPWMGDPRVHSSHRSILLAKDLRHYQHLGWTDEVAVRGDDGRWPYFWPTKHEDYARG